MTLQTITPKHRDLRQISIRIPFFLTVTYTYGDTISNATPTIGEPFREQWLDLDRLLVQLWESHSIRLRVVYLTRGDLRDCIGSLLPEMTKGGLVDLVQVC